MASPQTDTKQTAPAVKTNGVADKNQIVEIPLDSIFADYKWNSRQGTTAFDWDATETKDGKLESNDPETKSHAGGGTGFAGLVLGIKDVGQDTPVVVRPLPNLPEYQGLKKQYALTAGFRRYKAIERLHAEGVAIPNITGRGCIRAMIVPENESDAFDRNVRENTLREDLHGAELAFAVRRLLEMGMTQALIAGRLGKAQSYISTLGSITDPKDGIRHKKILEAWKAGTDLEGKGSAQGRLTVMDMLSIAKTPPEKQMEVYKEKCAAAEPKAKVTKVNAWRINAENRAKAIGAVLGTAAFYELIEGGANFKKKLGRPEVAAWFVSVQAPKKKNQTEKQRDALTAKGRDKIAEALVKGYDEGMADAKKAVEDREAAEAEALVAGGAEDA
jgi:ParB/RepB/Spo0J family partition protein